LVSETIFRSVVECAEVFRERHQYVDAIVQKQGRVSSDEHRGRSGSLPVDDARYPGLVVDIDVASVEVGMPESWRDELGVAGSDVWNCG
jgi:hypothetical protein